MAVYRWSELSDGAVINFDPFADQLIFDSGIRDYFGFSAFDSPENEAFFTDLNGKTVRFSGLYFKSMTPDNLQFEGSDARFLMGDLQAGTEGDDAANTITGSAANDYIMGFDVEDTLAGGDGDDVIFAAGGGNDTVDGGNGYDWYASFNITTLYGITANLTTGQVYFHDAGELDTLTSIEAVRGTRHNDTLIGDGGDNQFRGRNGDDFILGRGGTDWAVYNEGIATHSVVVNLTDNTAIDDGFGDTDYLYEIENVRGGRFDDFIQGDMHANFLRGDAGNDTLIGAAGNDILRGDGGADFIDGGAGADRANGGDGNDIFLMGADNDTVLGEAGNDYADMGEGDDYVDGGAGDNILLGGLGHDVMVGGADKDYIDAGDGFDYADGGAANDIFLMGSGNDTALGQAGNDYFDLGDGDDTAYGGDGDDIFLGGAGNDVFEAGAGLDVAIGGAGNDLYTVRSTGGLLLIYDFAAGGAEDAVLLDASTGITRFAQAQAVLSFNAGNNASVLTIDADTSVWLVGVTNAQLTAADFAFF